MFVLQHVQVQFQKVQVKQAAGWWCNTTCCQINSQTWELLIDPCALTLHQDYFCQKTKHLGGASRNNLIAQTQISQMISVIFSISTWTCDWWYKRAAFSWLVPWEYEQQAISIAKILFVIMLEFRSSSRNIWSHFNWPSFSLSPLKQAVQLKANPLKKKKTQCGMHQSRLALFFTESFVSRQLFLVLICQSKVLSK